MAPAPAASPPVANPVAAGGGVVADCGGLGAAAPPPPLQAVISSSAPPPAKSLRVAPLLMSHIVVLLCGLTLGQLLVTRSYGSHACSDPTAELSSSPPGTGIPTTTSTSNASSICALELAAAEQDLPEPAISHNQNLSGRHRVCVTQWTLIGAASANHSQRFSEPRSVARPLGGRNELTDELDSLFEWAAAHGYEGLEMTVDDFRARWFRTESYEEVIRQVQRRTARYREVRVVGSLFHVTDGDGLPGTGTARRMHSDGLRYDLDFADGDFWPEMRRRLEMQRLIGSEYVTFQISLPRELQNTGGEYRHDETYLRRAACNIARLQRLSFSAGLNFYVETHIARVSEDPEAFVKIMDYSPVYFEVNIDISHYAYRNIVDGAAYHRIMERAGHTHQRMARTFGDLSSEVIRGNGEDGGHAGTLDPHTDWEQNGLTYQAWDLMQLALRGGLSSRCIVGESGPWQLVVDSMALDAKLVPLYRLMAAHADQEARRTPTQTVRKPPNPFPPL
eukprot:SAG31_NODE_6339_length_2057_cov_3.064351_1_plen_506_part_00